MSGALMLSAQEVAERLNVSVATVYRLKDRREGLTAYRIGGVIRFRTEEVDAYVARQAVDPADHRQSRGPELRRFRYEPGMRVVDV